MLLFSPLLLLSKQDEKAEEVVETGVDEIHYES
jgi:hypothetical protein